MQACVNLAEQCGAEVVGCAFVVELTFLPGRKKLAPHRVESLVQYHDET
jgi:adenine phosphoribosyltransferase